MWKHKVNTLAMLMVLVLYINPLNMLVVILLSILSLAIALVVAHNGTHGVAAAPVGTNPLAISIVNNFANGVNAYVTGQTTAGAVVFLAPDGTFFYPVAGGAKIPTAITQNIALPLNGLNQTTEFVIHGYISSARIWVTEGTLSFFVF
jgi:hypothetical protein